MIGLKETRQRRRRIIYRTPRHIFFCNENARYPCPCCRVDILAVRMHSSGVEQTALLLTLVAACLSADASRNRVTVRKYRTNFRVDSWDDDRNDPYRVTFWKFGLKSIYTFDTSGNIRTLTARDTLYTFESEVAPRMLEDSDDDAEGDVGVGPRGISCTDCSATWNILCDVGMKDVCYLNDNPEDGFDEDAQDSLRRMCSGFGAACELSAFNACDGQCTGEEN